MDTEFCKLLYVIPVDKYTQVYESLINSKEAPEGIDLDVYKRLLEIRQNMSSKDISKLFIESAKALTGGGIFGALSKGLSKAGPKLSRKMGKIGKRAGRKFKKSKSFKSKSLRKLKSKGRRGRSSRGRSRSSRRSRRSRQKRQKEQEYEEESMPEENMSEEPLSDDGYSTDDDYESVQSMTPDLEDEIRRIVREEIEHYIDQ